MSKESSRRVGILGSGLIGGKLGTIFACAGHELLLMLFLTSYIAVATVSSGGAKNKIIYAAGNGNIENQTQMGHLTTNDYIRDLVNHPAFKGFGELILPRDDDDTSYYNTPLHQVGSLMPYHSQVNPDIVVGALNRMIHEVSAGKTIFYDFYTERQKLARVSEL